MSKASKKDGKKGGKGGIERRRHPRSSTRRSPPKKAPALNAVKSFDQNHCAHCAKDLTGEERALFVEEELGRVFCSEDCITAYFMPDIEHLEEEYFKFLSKKDLSPEEREKLAHLRWITLQEPDEIWRVKTPDGDYRYTLMSEFHPDKKPIWCIATCLFLRGEPSFLFISFPTKDPALLDKYRRGEKVQWARIKSKAQESSKHTKKGHSNSEKGSQDVEDTAPMDGLADEWTEDETYRARLMRDRKADDIPPEEFGLYQTCLDETLEEPDEVWTLEMPDKEHTHLYHFIRQYPDEKPKSMWFVIVARETDNEDEIEILDAFPTRDSELVESFRRGKQEIGSQEVRSAGGRLVH